MPPSVSAASNALEVSVSELSQQLKRTVEDTFGYVRVRGEISGYRGPHSSGHAYFALKDEGAKIDAVVWRASFGKLRFKPEEGMEVIATGRLTTYPGKSAYQIVIDTLEPAGVGALMALLEERKRKFQAEGLFAAERKRRIPYLPEVIGVVTSPTGAVIRDILHRVSDRFPRRVIVWPVRVQGETAAAEVAAAIRGFNALAPGGLIPRPDVLIVARGGGSLEDLWGFNEEIVVRAAAESAIPLVSAVGHETDTTLIDYVSDRRAPTPTAAAEMVTPVRAELLAATAERGARLRAATLRGMEARRTELRSAARALPTLETLIQIPRQRLDHAAARLRPALAANAGRHRARFAAASARLQPAALTQRVHLGRERADGLAARLERAATALADKRRDRLASVWKLVRSLSHEGVLERGYALVLNAEGHVLRRAAEVGDGEQVRLKFQDGERAATAGEGAAPPPPAAPQAQPAARRESKPRKPAPAPQSDLFG
ncbi:exodeoxyribonuclease VII large subunit [Methylopila sp. Yamaguchi]|uniref:exodeoxyribonuclease VII large subunit n=1 Tax=Methylopila sp. Yamaguchi TaxID=1437817 RepID=UPI000CCB8A3F|nr:exodeoxyribonuclease VII large subunit [Methylopila sp. Yamaguchi]GBD48448.1 exodeoxyribonuclease VII, large subunit [Methylopila sp. Yamaguchi]